MSIDEATWTKFHRAIEQWAATRPFAPLRKGRLLRPAEWDGMPPVTEIPDATGRRYLTEMSYDLAIRDADSGSPPRRLTTCGTEQQPWRVNAQVWSLVPDPAVWAPDGRYLISAQVSYAGVPRYPVVVDGDTPPTVHFLPQPIEAAKHHGSGNLAIINVQTRHITPLDLQANVVWAPLRWEQAPDAVLLLGIELSGVLWLARAEVPSGRVVVLRREELPSVFPYLAGAISAVRAPAEAGTCWWISDCDGDRRLYRLTADTAVPVTPPGIQVIERAPRAPSGLLAALDPAEPYTVAACRYEPDGSLQSIGVVSAEDADDGGEPFVVAAADGSTPLHGVLFRPPGFTPDNSYPLVHSIYGGPQAVAHRGSATHLWGSCRAIAAALSQLGVVTTVVDARGTPGRGRAFQWPAVADRVATVVDDHRAALHGLARERPWIDLSRCGVIGTSLGGYFAAQCGLRHPELFRAVVAHAGPYHPPDVLAGWFPALLQTTFDEDMEAFIDAGLVAHAKDFKPPLLLIHGTADTNVTINHTMRFTEALNAAGRHHELLLLPGHRHHLDLDTATFALEAAARFFVRHLRPEN